MTYLITWSNIALSELSKLPDDIADRIIKKLDQIKENPPRFIERLVSLSGSKLRVGDHRIILDIIEPEKIIAIRTLGHRKNIYKKYKTD